MSVHESKSVVDRLVKKKNVAELVKLMKPLDVAKVVVKDLGLCPDDASAVTIGLIKRVHESVLCESSFLGWWLNRKTGEAVVVRVTSDSPTEHWDVVYDNPETFGVPLEDYESDDQDLVYNKVMANWAQVRAEPGKYIEFDLAKPFVQKDLKVFQKFLDTQDANLKKVQVVVTPAPFEKYSVSFDDFMMAKSSRDLVGEGLARPAIEKGEYPVSNAKDKSGKQLLSDPYTGEDVDEHLGMPQGKDINSPRFDIKRWHFPPDPRDEPEGWPYDDMTTAHMNSKKGAKRGLTSGKVAKGGETIKDVKKKKIYAFSEKYSGKSYNPSARNPGGDGAGGGGIYQKNSPHNRTNNQPTQGRGWSARGVPGWSTSQSGEEFDLPYGGETEVGGDADKKKVFIFKDSDLHRANAGEVDDIPSFMKDPPVGSSIPTLNKGSSTPGPRKGFRRK